MAHRIECKCGALGGTLEHGAEVNRAVCYCDDCQAFARFLGRDNEVLDGAGGTEVIQTLQSRVRFERGHEHLACMRLSPRGMLRWYARCCNTPLGNTLPNHKLAMFGLVHSCVQAEEGSLDRAFGPRKTIAFTK
ncbi:MAG TPA: DUF6151 family protein, partial [Noviherbaspirillum sp.]|nr:DUF6151 family protein [Noviherbaspirillum sp.]